MQDTKIALMNLMSFVISFTNIEQWLKLVLLLVSITYTILKIIELKKKKDE
jgi:hypothetical protein